MYYFEMNNRMGEVALSDFEEPHPWLSLDPLAYL